MDSMTTAESTETRPRIIIYGGSFDPPHFSHKAIVDYVLDNRLADEVWLTPCGNRTDKNLIFSPEERYQLMIDILGDRKGVKVSRKETDNKEMIPTYTLMKLFASENPGSDLMFLIGSDLVDGIKDWHNSKEFLD